MRYAILADIHSNIDALRAVLEETKNLGIDKYIFAGDYTGIFPYPNEVVKILRDFDDAIITNGNGERALANSAKKDQSTWTDGQMQSHYWDYRNLSKENHYFIRNLPKTINFNDNGINILITHKSSDLYGTIEYMKFSSRRVEMYYRENFTGREKILHDIQNFIQTDIDFHAASEHLTDGIYIFGHTHIQWHARHGGKIYINPGSCGIPLDGVSGAPYTVLEIENSNIKITEHRAKYDIKKSIQNMKNSDLYKAAPVWSELMIMQLDTCFEYAWPFIEFADKYANKIGDHVRPFSLKTWAGAYRQWKNKNLT